MLARGRVPSYTAAIPMERTRLVGMQKRTESGQCQNSFESPQGAGPGRACASSGGIGRRGLPALATLLLLTTVPSATAQADELPPEDRGAVDDRRWEHRVSMRTCYEARGWQLRMADADGLTALSIAAGRKHKELTEFLADLPEVDVNKASESGITPLLMVAEVGWTDVMRKLLKRGKFNIHVFSLNF